MRVQLIALAIGLSSISTVASADPSTHELHIGSVSTMKKTDCGTGAGGKMTCVPACIVKYSFKKVGHYDQDDDVNVEFEFRVPTKIRESGVLTLGSLFPLKDASTDGSDFIPGVKCSQAKFIDVKAECRKDVAGKPHCREFAKIRVTSKSKMIVPHKAVLFPD